MKFQKEDIELKTIKGKLLLRVEPMTAEDLDEVMALERRCFPAPWSERLFREELEHPWAVLELFRMIEGPTEFWDTLRENKGKLFSEGDKSEPSESEEEGSKSFPLIGYMDYWLVHEELHLLSLAVNPDFRRLGLGELMVNRVIAATCFVAGRRVRLEVRKNNKPARNLYEKLGFIADKVKKGYYSDTGEDALVLIRNMV